jgi:hypothetical protein
MRDKIRETILAWLLNNVPINGRALLADELADEVMAVIEAGPPVPAEGHCLKSAYEDFHS